MTPGVRPEWGACAIGLPGIACPRELAALAGGSRLASDARPLGFIEFILDEAAGLVRVYHVVWTG